MWVIREALQGGTLRVHDKTALLGSDTDRLIEHRYLLQRSVNTVEILVVEEVTPTCADAVLVFPPTNVLVSAISRNDITRPSIERQRGIARQYPFSSSANVYQHHSIDPVIMYSET